MEKFGIDFQGRILDQLMPAPDEAPMTSCPHCGEDSLELHSTWIPGLHNA